MPVASYTRPSVVAAVAAAMVGNNCKRAVEEMVSVVSNRAIVVEGMAMVGDSYGIAVETQRTGKSSCSSSE